MGLDVILAKSRQMRDILVMKKAFLRFLSKEKSFEGGR
jgi:hypothetical protein